jgi:hypothetical protein
VRSAGEEPRPRLRPLLVFHEEAGGAFDVDAAARFLELTGPLDAVLVGDAPAQAVDALEWAAGRPLRRVPAADLAGEFPGDRRDVVHVAADYELALGASALAALTDRLLVVRGGALDRPATFAGASVLLVGDVSCPEGATCAAGPRTAAELRARASEALPGTIDRVVLASHADLEDGVDVPAGYVVEYGPPLERIGAAFSLAAPYLAAARRALLLTTAETEADGVDAALEAALAALAVAPRYLAIVAAPTAIPMAILRPDEPGALWGYHFETDMTAYASDGAGVPDGLGFLGDDQFADAATGRILGVTVTDVSAYVARELYADALVGERTGKAVLDDDGGIDHVHVNDRLAAMFEASGWTTAYNRWGTLGNRDYAAAAAIAFAGHGYEEGTAGFLTTERLRRIRDLFPAVVYLSACLTCNYQPASAPDLFCSHLVRYGATGVIAAVGYGNDENKLHHWLGLLLEGKTIGDAFRDMRMEWHDLWYYDFMNPLLLIGDPLFRPSLDPVDESWFPSSTVTAGEDAGRWQVRIVVEEPLDPTQTYLMRPPLMPGTEAADSGLFGVPRLHYRFDGLAPGEEPTSLEVQYLLGDGTYRFTARSTCGRRRGESDLLAYDWYGCVPDHTEACVDAECTTAEGGSAEGVTASLGALLPDWSAAGRRYTLTATGFHFDPAAPLTAALREAGPVAVRIEVRLGHRPAVP